MTLNSIDNTPQKEKSMTRKAFPVFSIGLLISSITLTARLGASGPLPGDDAGQHSAHADASSSRLVELVREATAIFRDVNQATGYAPFGGCVSGPEEGAMGVHFVNEELLFDEGKLDVNKPEALIYELKNGRARLVGVEYIVLAADWDTAHSEPPVPPVLEGQLFHFNESPNRFRLPPFYELHVWAWRDNPNGAFADWNTRVSCDGQ
jgi:hypothetical protein